MNALLRRPTLLFYAVFAIVCALFWAGLELIPHSFLSQFADLTIHVARMSSVMLGAVATKTVATSLAVCLANRKRDDGTRRSLAELLKYIQPFDLTLLLAGILFSLAAWQFGGGVFTFMDFQFLQRFQQVPGDMAVALTWTLWAFSAVFVVAAFSPNPRQKFKATGIMVSSLMIVLGLTGQF